MPYWSLKRHVVYLPRGQDTIEVWGIDRPAPHICTTTRPQILVDNDDPLGDSCALLVTTKEGALLTWDRMMEFFSEIEVEGYEPVISLSKLSPFSTIVLRRRVSHATSC